MSMPAIPTLPDIYGRICTDIELYLPGAAARAPESLLSTLAAAEAGAVHEVYGFLQWIVRQILPDTADEEVLVRWGNLLNVTRLANEPLENFRSRVVLALQERSRIGDSDDYVRWTLASYADITHAWVVTGGTIPLGDIHIYCVTGNLPSPIPSPELLASATTALDRIRNVGCRVYLMPPTAQTVSIRIAGVPDSVTRAEIEAELARLFARKFYSQALLLEAEIDAAIQRYTLNYTLYPVGNVQAGSNELITLGGVTWLV